MKMTEPYSPSARANASAKPVSSAGVSIGKITRQKTCQRFAPRLDGGFFQFRVEVFENRLHRPHDERQADERQRDENAELRVGDFDAERRQQLPDPAVVRIQRRQRDAGDGGRQRERQIHQRVHDFFAEKFVAHQNPRDDEAENDVDQRGAKTTRQTSDDTRPAPSAW